MSVASVLCGFAFTMVLGLGVKPLLKVFRACFAIPEISSDKSIQARWEDLYKHPDPSGEWIGHFERVFLFFALYCTSWEAVGIWLVFKLGSKWEAWNQMGYVPDDPNRRDKDGNLLDEEIPLLKWAYARRIWAAQGYGTFVVGTATNMFLAAIGVFVSKRGTELLTLLHAFPVDCSLGKC